MSRLPEWLRVKLPSGPTASTVERRIRGLGLHTVCDSARCPNRGECWGAGTATLLILGDTCTRNCRFCAVKKGNPKGAFDPDEPAAVARMVAESGLRYVVLTSVDRDDLPDGGAGHYAATIQAIRERVPGVTVEALIPDYLGPSLEQVLSAGPDVLGHNVEVVQRLTPTVRDRRASYERSLDVLRSVRRLAPAVRTKSSLLLGLGEEEPEIEECLRDLRAAGVSAVTLGQYLRPTARHLPVVRYVPPAEFDAWGRKAREMGFVSVSSGPLVRSSYRAGEWRESDKNRDFKI